MSTIAIHNHNTTTPSKARAVKRAKAVEGDGASPNAVAKFEKAAAELVNVHFSRVDARAQAEQAYASGLAKADETAMAKLEKLAKGLPGLTEADWAKYMHRPIMDGMTARGLKAPGPQVSKLKVAFFAFLHGLKPSKDAANNYQKFADESGAVLKARGVLAPTKQGKKKGTTSEHMRDERKFAAVRLAQTGNVAADVVATRVEALMALTTAGNWKYFESVLAEAMRTIRPDKD